MWKNSSESRKTAGKVAEVKSVFSKEPIAHPLENFLPNSEEGDEKAQERARCLTNLINTLNVIMEEEKGMKRYMSFL